MAEIVCWNCGASLAEIPRPISRHANCPACYEDLHCCRLCRHFRRDITGQCDDDRTDPPIHKETANFCDYFRPLADAYRAKTGIRRDAARARLLDLFDDGGEEASSAGPADDVVPPSREEEARARLNALFGKDSDS